MKTCPVVVEVVPEILEYKLEYTPDLRCEKQTDLVPVCHSCKSCILSWKAFSTREWFVRASRASQGQFLVGIIKRFKSQDLLKYAWNLLQATDTKDFTYSRSCVSSSLMASSTLDRALDPQKLEQSMADLWKWFLNASFWSKANYILLLLQMCDTQLLLMAASMIRIFLSQDEMVTSKMVEKDKALLDKDQAEDVVIPPKEHEKSGTVSHFTSHSSGFSSIVQNYLASEKSSTLGHLRSQRVWSKESDQLSGDSSEGVDSASGTSTALNVTKSSQKPPNINKFKDFIRCLPIHLSKYILRMLDLKSLNRCAKVSPHWNFLVKQIRKDIISNRSLRSEIAYLQGSCPKRAISNYAKIVKVTIPRINTEGNIISLIIKNKQLIRKESEHLHKAYHGQETNTVKLEERNVFCGGYNVRILIDSLDPNRVIHYSGGKLLAIGSVDRKVHLMDMNDLKRVPPILFGHAGSIRAIYLNEQKGLLLSGSYDLSIRMWNIFTGSCVKIFNGHSGSITCLDLYKNKFVSGSKDCTAKMWNIETGKCMKTFGHKAIVWAAKMNETHVVSACDKGLVKVWHAETCILIKTLQGHLGPVKCLSFDQWHLVTGSSDGYILGWSMLGNHKRCLGAFRHPMEVLSLGFLYLRVISGCADGKIRIFNFLTGTCLRVMRANSRGDPVVSFCMVDNKLVINAQSSVVLFQFEEVIWDHTQTSDRLIKTKEKCKFDDTPFRIQPSPHSLSQRKRRANKNNWKLYSTDTVLSYYITRQSIRCSKDTPGLCYEIVREPPPRTSPQMRKTVAALDIKPDDKHRLSSLAINQRRKSGLEDSKSVSTLVGSSGPDDESEHEPLAPASSKFGQNAEAFIKYIKKKLAHGPLSNDQLLLTVSTMQHAYQTDHVSANMAHNMKIKDAWGAVHLQKEQRQNILVPQNPEQQKMDPSTQLKRLKAARGILGMERISTPYEVKTLQLNLKNSLLGSSVKSFIPVPTITRSKSCNSLSGGKKKSGQAKMPPPTTTRGKVIGHYTTSSESIKVPRMKIAQPDTDIATRRGKLFFVHSPNPYRLNTGFQLLTTQQMKEYEEAKIHEYQAKKTKVIANREKESKNAWLRKIKGLPIDDFTKEGKVAAPELGDNVFI